jgi:glycosyltransferase involved in cell wall biosynthesis
MPVYNALPHLDQAIESILKQTLSEFEFVILDDASTDGSRERLEHWAELDSRIRLLEGDENLGPVGSSNFVARAARAPFVARMDADDISYPERLAEQIHVLREHPEVGLVASLCDMIDSAGRKVRGPEVWRLSRQSVFVPFAHGATMYRREVFDVVGGYREQCEFWEDQDLVVRISAVSSIAVIPRPLYRVRQSATSTRVVSGQERLEQALDKFYQATDRLGQGQDYEGIFQAPAKSDHKLDPRVFISFGAVRLWAGGKPRLFRRFLSHAQLSWNARTLVGLVWTTWASASPATLRAFLMFLLKARNRFTSGQISTEDPVLWHPRRRLQRFEKVESKP